MEKKIIVSGSLNPEKEVQDRVRVLSGGGICQGLRATDYKDPPKVVRSIKSIKRSRWTVQNSKEPVSEKQHCEFYG